MSLVASVYLHCARTSTMMGSEKLLISTCMVAFFRPDAVGNPFCCLFYAYIFKTRCGCMSDGARCSTFTIYFVAKLVTWRELHCTCTFISMLMNAKRMLCFFPRYKKEWLHDCLLLKVKPTAVYTFLQEKGSLPLPNPRTLYGYLKSLKADFGFEASLFAVLREKLQGVPERERRS